MPLVKRLGIGLGDRLGSNLITEVVPDACSGPVYAARTDVELVFGRTNVSKWADVDNEEDSTFITNRICWALQEAYSHFNNRLRGGPYAVPFIEPFESQIISMSARLAGVMLYDSRGITDFSENGKPQHQLSAHRDMVEKFIKDVMAGIIRLDAEHVVNYPAVVSCQKKLTSEATPEDFGLV